MADRGSGRRQRGSPWSPRALTKIEAELWLIESFTLS
jgi:hypothetical protein